MNTFAITGAETRAELTKLTRLPAYVIPTLAFPVCFYLFFGILMAGNHPAGDRAEIARYLLASYGAFGVIGASLFGFGVGIATERGQGWMLVKRASPMPPIAYITAKVLTALAFAALIVAVLSLIGGLVGGVRLPFGTWLALDASLIFGALPFCAIGCAIGWLAGPNSAAPIVQLAYLPLSFLGGLWVPIGQLPQALQSFAVWLPTYHLGQLGLGVLGFARGTSLEHIGALALWTAVGIGVAVVAMKADEGKTYG